MPPLVEPAPDLSREEIERYSRHLTLTEVGPLGQRRLKNARVLVIGAGGLGSPALQYLAAAGVGTIGVVDDDHVSISNLQRQVVHGTEDVGRPKTESAAEAVARLNPHVTVRTHPVRLSADNALDLVREYDLVLDGADNFATRYLVSDACVLAGVPCVWGSILRFEGRVSVFRAEHGPTYRDLHPEAPPAGEVPSCAEGGVLGMLPAAVGAVMVTEAVKLITGIGEPLIGRVLLHDALTMRWREIGLMKDPEAAPVREVGGGDQGSGAGSSGGHDDHAVDGVGSACSADGTVPASTGATRGGPATHETVTATELSQLLESRSAGTTSFVLVDVRDDWERHLVSIPGAVPVPLDELLSRGAEALPADARGVNLVLHCKAGARSAKALAALRPHFATREETLRHLDGGVLAWIDDVAPDQPRY
ncbi:molybdopterin-synthase adenylyltransferase MoeB [Brevibacterium yomogidense]|uniref:molybdopterin-synthase adenylyltransferase MoeB n=1 Tax=Brevibacterium yomogidense TaxID=946573 RepID=UPI002FCCE403